MKKMKHIKTTRLYEEFILLMLDIKHIVKEDKLFIFLWVIRAFCAKYYVFAYKLTEKPPLKLI